MERICHVQVEILHFPHPVWDKRKGHGHRACDTQGRSSDAPDTFSRNKSSDVLKNKFSFQEGILQPLRYAVIQCLVLEGMNKYTPKIIKSTMLYFLNLSNGNYTIVFHLSSISSQ